MDDFYNLLPPKTDYREVLKILRAQAKRCKFNFTDSKTRYVPLTKPFRYCKTKYILTESGKIVTRANKKAIPRDRRKIKSLHEKWRAGKIDLETVWASINGMFAYLDNYNEHNNVLKLRRLFYSLFGFSCESIENFRRSERDGIHHGKKIQA